MKKLMIMMVVLGSVAFGRDLTYNEKRDVVKPVQEQQERLNRYSSLDWKMDKEVTEKNFDIYSEFHRDLENMDKTYNKR